MEQAGAPSPQSPVQRKLEQTENVIEQELMPFVMASLVTQEPLDSDNLHIKVKKEDLQRLMASHRGLPVLDWDQMVHLQIRYQQEEK
jgi:hypothetical protein